MPGGTAAENPAKELAGKALMAAVKPSCFKKDLLDKGVDIYGSGFG